MALGPFSLGRLARPATNRVLAAGARGRSLHRGNQQRNEGTRTRPRLKAEPASARTGLIAERNMRHRPIFPTVSAYRAFLCVRRDRRPACDRKPPAFETLP